jgi:hypothetical protein
MPRGSLSTENCRALFAKLLGRSQNLQLQSILNAASRRTARGLLNACMGETGLGCDNACGLLEVAAAAKATQSR